MSADWNAVVYHQVSEPQYDWGLSVLSRLTLAGTERALDVGCGTGRLTLELARRLSHGKVIAADRSASMLDAASHRLQPSGIGIVQADATQLPFARAFDLIFSTATFHWVLNHDALFRSLFQALRPGGRLHAQCGGGANLERLITRANALMGWSQFAPHFQDFRQVWLFAGPEDTTARLTRIGFENVEAGLEAAPVTFDGSEAFQTFVDHVCIHPYLRLLPENLHKPFSDELVNRAASDTPPFTLDYCRLNITANRPR